MSLTLQNINGVHVASVNGPLDAATGADLIITIKSSVQKGATLILDCGTLIDMDMGGFKHLLALQRWCQAGDSRLILAGMPPELWSMVKDNRCEGLFETSPSTAAALQSLGMGGAALYTQPTPTLQFEQEPSPFHSDPGSHDADMGGAMPPPLPTDDPWAEPPPAESAGHFGEAGGWPQPDTVGWGAATGASSQETKGGGKGFPTWMVAALVILLAAGATVGGYLLFEELRKPTISLSVATIEVTEGKEPPDVQITVSNGNLEQLTDLPEDLSVEFPLEETVDPKIYKIGGQLKTGAQAADVQFVAKRGQRQSEPVTLQVRVRPKPLEWLFDPPALKVGYPISGYIKVVDGAKDVKPKWSPADPGGFAVNEDPRAKGLWKLSGNPVKAGKYKLQFLAADLSGTSVSSQEWEIEIKGDAPPTPAPGPGPGPGPAPTPAGLYWPPEFRELQLVEAERIRTYATFVKGAETVSPMWQPRDPGLQITRAPGSNNWSLEGAPKESGEFQLTVSATAAGGQPETQRFDFQISPKERPRPTPEPGPDSPERLDEDMKRFLLERIEKANDHFSTEEKANLRKMVGMLKDARRIAIIHFGTGKFTLSEKEEYNLKLALKKHKDLLADKDCEILVVGYASPTGSKAANIRLSRRRAQSVDSVLTESVGRSAELCGDYGPTDILSDQELGNQAVEVFAGIIDMPAWMEPVADKFKADFNSRHGGR